MWYKGLYNYGLNGLGYDAQKAWQWANANLIDGNYGLGYNVYTVPQGEVMIGTNGKLNPNAKPGRIHSYNGQNYLLLPDDWEDETYGNGLRQEYTVTAQSANERGSFYASANYLDNEGITVASDYKRFSARLKADQQLKSWLKVGVNMAYSHFNYNATTVPPAVPATCSPWLPWLRFTRCTFVTSRVTSSMTTWQASTATTTVTVPSV